MLAVPSLADRQPILTIAAQAGASAGKGASKADGAQAKQTFSFLELLQQSAAAAPDTEGVAKSLENSSAKQGQQDQHGQPEKKSSTTSPDHAASAPAVSSDSVQGTAAFLPSFTPAAGAERVVQSEHSSADQGAAALRKALTTPTLATRSNVPVRDGLPVQDGLHVSVSEGRATGTPTELAFALRLKPLAAAAVASLPAASSISSTHGIAAKANGTQSVSSGNLPTIQPTKEASANSHGGNDSSSRGDHASTRKSNLPEQPQKTASTEKVASSEPSEHAERTTVQGRSEGSRVAPLVDEATARTPLAESPESSSAPAQKAPEVATAPLDLEDHLASSRPAREISLQVSSDDDRKVDVRLVERSGEVHVSVRTPDATLAHEMRQDLGSLTGKLTQSGFQTEHFTPVSTGSSSLQDHRNNPENQDSDRGYGQDQRQGGSGQQQQQQQDERGQRPAWVEEMEDSLAPRQTNRSTA